MLLTREHVQRIVNEKAATPFAQRNFLEHAACDVQVGGKGRPHPR